MQNILAHSDKYKNYDFLQNWDKIVDILKDEIFFKKIYEPIVKNYKMFHLHDKRKLIYSKKLIAPSELSSYDVDANLYNMIYKNITTKNNKLLPKEMLDEYKKMNRCPIDIDPDDYYNSDMYNEWYVKFYSRIMDEFNISWKINPYAIWHWIPAGQCHFFNKHFGLKVAKKLMPDKIWQLIVTDTHTTVVCIEDKLFFDLLLWGCSNKETYMKNVVLKRNCKYINNDEIGKDIIILLNGS